jgi:hypothetical protein
LCRNFTMSDTAFTCPCCGDLMVPAEAALNRSVGNLLLFGFGSSRLEVRPRAGGRWMPFMISSRSAEASFCSTCGALLVAPSLPAQRRELGLE